MISLTSSVAWSARLAQGGRGSQENLRQLTMWTGIRREGPKIPTDADLLDKARAHLRGHRSRRTQSAPGSLSSLRAACRRAISYQTTATMVMLMRMRASALIVGVMPLRTREKT